MITNFCPQFQYPCSQNPQACKISETPTLGQPCFANACLCRFIVAQHQTPSWFSTVSTLGLRRVGMRGFSGSQPRSRKDSPGYAIRFSNIGVVPPQKVRIHVVIIMMLLTIWFKFMLFFNNVNNSMNERNDYDKNLSSSRTSSSCCCR